MAQQPSRLTLDEALASSAKETKRRYSSFVNPELASLLALLGLDRKFVRAQGCVITDVEGRDYLDCLGGYGALNLGHNHPEITAVLSRVSEAPNFLQVSLSPLAAALAETLAAVSPGELRMSFFGNSGAEAVEGALKLARAATGRPRLLYCEGSFHGKSFGALSVTGRVRFRERFEPLLPGCEAVPYGDAAALREALGRGDCAAFIVEPIQGEGGIIVPPDGYLKDAERACREASALLIVDEIQTGFGRTGRLFASEWDGAHPDIMVVAKSLGGGVMPIGAYVAREDVWKRAYGTRESCVLHTSTFGGNARACAVGLKAVEIIERDRLSEQAERKGARLLQRLNEIASRSRIVKTVRGRGLLIGVEFAESRVARGLSKEYLASMVAGLLLSEHQIITAYTLNNPNVIRFEPPLIIADDDLERVADAFEQVCTSHRGLLGVSADLGRSVIAGRLRH